MKRNILAIIISTLLALFFLWNFGGVKTDFALHQFGHHYTNMVHGEGAPSPYCYRILIPYLSCGSVLIANFLIAISLALAGFGLFLLTGLIVKD